MQYGCKTFSIVSDKKVFFSLQQYPLIISHDQQLVWKRLFS